MTKIVKNTTKEIAYREQYGVIVICQNEQEQKRTYERFKKEGLTLKIVTV